MKSRNTIKNHIMTNISVYTCGFLLEIKNKVGKIESCNILWNYKMNFSEFTYAMTS